MPRHRNFRFGDALHGAMVGLCGGKSDGIHEKHREEQRAHKIAEIDGNPVAHCRPWRYFALQGGRHQDGVVAGEELGAENHHKDKSNGKRRAAEQTLQRRVARCKFGKSEACHHRQHAADGYVGACHHRQQHQFAATQLRFGYAHVYKVVYDVFRCIHKSIV